MFAWRRHRKSKRANDTEKEGAATIHAFIHSRMQGIDIHSCMQGIDIHSGMQVIDIHSCMQGIDIHFGGTFSYMHSFIRLRQRSSFHRFARKKMHSEPKRARIEAFARTASRPFR